MLTTLHNFDISIRNKNSFNLKTKYFNSFTQEFLSNFETVINNNISDNFVIEKIIPIKFIDFENTDFLFSSYNFLINNTEHDFKVFIPTNHLILMNKLFIGNVSDLDKGNSVIEFENIIFDFLVSIDSLLNNRKIPYNSNFELIRTEGLLTISKEELEPKIENNTTVAIELFSKNLNESIYIFLSLGTDLNSIFNFSLIPFFQNSNLENYK